MTATQNGTATIAAGFPGVRVISQANQERGASRNMGIRSSHSTYVALLDADDEWLPEHLEHAVRKLADKKADVTFGAHDVVDPSGRVLWTTRPWPESEFDDGQRIFQRVQFGGLCASNVVARREVFEAFPFHQDKRMAAAENWHCFARMCGSVVIRPFTECSARYHLHGANTVLRADHMAAAMRFALADLLQLARFQRRGRLARRQIESRALLTLAELARGDPRSLTTREWRHHLALATGAVAEAPGRRP